MNIISYNEFYNDCDKLCYQIAKSSVKIDAICPVMRSGMIPSFKVAERLNLPIIINDSIHGGNRTNFNIDDIKTILIIDDAIGHGTSINKECIFYKNKYKIYTACVILKPNSPFKPDFFVRHVDQPRVFEWNMLHTGNVRSISFDMDGVLCQNPTVFDNDGLEYEECIKSAKPLFIPTYKVGYIITNRIERWRSITEAWLKSHNVLYDKLIMQQFSTAVERRKKSTPASYKAHHYSKINSVLFIESCEIQAKEINKLTNKLTYCMENNTFYGK